MWQWRGGATGGARGHEGARQEKMWRGRREEQVHACHACSISRCRAHTWRTRLRSTTLPCHVGIPFVIISMQTPVFLPCGCRV